MGDKDNVHRSTCRNIIRRGLDRGRLKEVGCYRMNVRIWTTHFQVRGDALDSARISAHERQIQWAVLHPQSGAALSNGGGGADDHYPLFLVQVSFPSNGVKDLN